MKLKFALFPLIPVLCSALNAQVQAYRSYDVYNSVGVNTHWTDGAPYNYLDQFSTLVSMLQQANIYHIRDGEWGNGTDTAPWVTSMWSQLNAAGIKSDLITVSNNPTQTLSQLEADLKLYPGLESIEAMNEWDINGGPGWVSSMQAKLPILHQAGVDLGLPVIGPSLVEQSSFSQLGDISQYLTYGNVHDYQGFYNPETPGWGGGVDAEGNGYGSILWNEDMAHEYAPGLPIIATETGYQTGLPGIAMPETVEGIYAPRIYLASFLSGIPRTYVYELLDDPDGWSTWGLLHYDLTPKPAFTAISNLLSFLKDVNTQFTPESLNYSLTGNMNGVETILVEKSTGDFYLIMWLDGSVFNPTTLQATTIAPQPLTLSLPAGLIVSDVDSFAPAGTVTTTSANQSFYTVNANSCITMLHIVSATATSTPVLSVPSGSYTSIQTLALSDPTPGAQIVYTTNGSAPTASSTLYTGPISVAGSETVNAVAVAPGGSASAVASATYTVNLPTAAAPAVSVAPGTYASEVSVNLSDSTPGAKIYYTTDGSIPTASSPLYAGPITVASSATVNALSVAWGYNNSPVTSATYFISGTASASLINLISQYQIVNQASGLCIAGVSGGPLAQSQCSPGNGSEQWMFSASSTAGYYNVAGIPLEDRPVWAVSGGSTVSNTPVQLAAASEVTFQHWAPELLTSGYYEFVDVNSGLCLTVPGGANTSGLQLQISPCTGVASQSFVIGSVSTTLFAGAWYEAVSGMSGMCLTDPGAAASNGTALIQATCGTLLNQEWQFYPTSNGYMAVDNGSVISLVWDDTNGSTANGNGMQLWSWANDSNQEWLPNSQSNGLWTFANRTSGDCLDNGNSTGSGTRMTQWQCGSWNPNQQFELLRVR